MKMLRFLCVSCIMALLPVAYVSAQELHCTVQINSDKVKGQPGVDPATFPALQNSITEFMNQRSWTQDAFAAEERIDCSLYITIDGVVSQDQYTGTITIQSSRPAFNSTYNSPLLNFRDLDFVFTYAINTPLDFNVNQYTNNLSSVLGYYAYLIIGLDYASMSKGGGDKFFTLAEQVTNQVPTTASDAKGWKPFDSNPLTQGKNRYNIISSLMGGKFELYKQALYEYHVKGIDLFYDDPVTARANIADALDKIDKAFKDNANNVLLILFLQAKGDELVGIFAGAEQSEKTRITNLLKRLDPANGTKYDKILKT